jgi:hypothetical protein
MIDIFTKKKGFTQRPHFPEYIEPPLLAQAGKSF